MVRHADWIVDVGPAAGQHGGDILYSGPPAGLAGIEASQTRRYLFREHAAPARTPARARGWLRLAGVSRNNLRGLDVAFPLGVFTSVTGISGSGKSSLVSQVLVELVAGSLGHEIASEDEDADPLERPASATTGGKIVGGLGGFADSCASTRSRSAGRRGRTSPPTRGCSTPFAGSSPGPNRRGPAATTPGGSRSTSPRAGARTAGRGLRHGRAALPAERLCPLPGLPRRTLQRQDARDQVSGEEHRRRPRDDRRRRARVLRRRAAGPPRWTSCTTSAWGISGSASRPPSCRAARRSGSSSRPSCSGPSGATPSTSSTSRRPACTRPTSRS